MESTVAMGSASVRKLPPLSQRFGNQPPERGACGDAPNSAVMLLQRRHGCSRERFGHAF